MLFGRNAPSWNPESVFIIFRKDIAAIIKDCLRFAETYLKEKGRRSKKKRQSQSLPDA
jgi:hypothetical protein